MDLLPHESKILSDAITFAVQAHAGQTDRRGLPFVLHPIRVAERQTTVIRRVIALLHDTIEDTHITASDIEAAFGADIARSVDILSRTADQTWSKYMERILLADEDTKHVKLHDIADNLHIHRMDTKGAKNYPMYLQAYNDLCESLGIDVHFRPIV